VFFLRLEHKDGDTLAWCKGNTEFNMPVFLYDFPQPMTGEVPGWLREHVTKQPTHELETIELPPTLSDPDTPRIVGKGFVVPRTMHGVTADGAEVGWEERWLVVQRTAYGERQPAAFDTRVL
jgi:hypothetical protein